MVDCIYCLLAGLRLGETLGVMRSESHTADVSIEGTRAGEKRSMLWAVPLRHPVCERPLPHENPCPDSSRPRAFD